MDKRPTIKFGEYPTPIPVFKCRTLDGKELLAMVDTGSEVTIFDPQLSDNLIAEEEDGTGITLHSIHGEDESNSSMYRLPLSVKTEMSDDSSLHLRGIKSDLSSVSQFLKASYGWDEELYVVIGSDTLKAMEWIIDFDNNQIVL